MDQFLTVFSRSLRLDKRNKTTKTKLSYCIKKNSNNYPLKNSITSSSSLWGAPSKPALALIGVLSDPISPSLRARNDPMFVHVWMGVNAHWCGFIIAVVVIVDLLSYSRVDPTMGTKIKGLLKGLRQISNVFDAKDQEIQIGFPTDVKHVAHIGWDGPSTNSPDWMNGFRSTSPTPQISVANGRGNELAISTEWPSQDFVLDGATKASSPRGLPAASKPSAKPSRHNVSSEVANGHAEASAPPKQSRRHHPTHSDSPARESSEGSRRERRERKASAGSGGSDSSSSSAAMQESSGVVPKQPRRKKATKGSATSNGGSVRSSARSKAVAATTEQLPTSPLKPKRRESEN